MQEILEKQKVNLKDMTLFNFVEILNSKGIIKQYYEEIPDVEVEYFTEDEEKQMLNNSKIKKLNELLDKTF